MKKLIVAFTALFFFVGASAQQKIGYINAEELIYSMPEAKKADADINAFAKTFQDRLASMQKEFETKYKSYQDAVEAKTLTEAMQTVREKELQDLQANIQSTQQTAEEKVQAKRQELLKPITDKADKAIQEVAKAKGYTFIFDSSTAGLVYAASDNIIDDVKASLGIKDTPAAAPKTPAPNKAPAPTPKH